MADNFIEGTSGKDILTGTSSNDCITGKEDNDILFGRKEDDLLEGGSGSDLLSGGKGNDTLFGDKGNDLLFGGKGDDELNGGEDHDTLFGGKGNDFLTGGNGNDVLVGGNGNDTLFGASFDNSTPVIAIFPPPPQPTPFQKDILIGGKGSDRFTLSTIGPADQSIQPYLGEGYAIIKDFNRTEGDRIELLGSREDYMFRPTNKGTKILLDEDLIAIVRGDDPDPENDIDYISQFVIGPPVLIGEESPVLIDDLAMVQ